MSPDLATALPQPTAGGRAYTFQLRPGVRYSTGATVKPEDVRREIERVFDLNGPGVGYYTGIVGATTCTRHKDRCDLSTASSRTTRRARSPFT